MNVLIGVVGLFTVAAVTPGPNNFIVMRTAARGGLAKALPEILGVVLGGIVLLALISAGAGALFTLTPFLQTGITIIGCVYLIALGGRLLLASRDRDAAAGRGVSKGRLAGFGGLFLFQFLNPKGWLMMLTAASVVPATSIPGALVWLAAVFTPISLVCLLIWAGSGRLLSAPLAHPAVGRWFDRVMAALLIGSATLLLFDL